MSPRSIASFFPDKKDPRPIKSKWNTRILCDFRWENDFFYIRMRFVILIKFKYGFI